MNDLTKNKNERNEVKCKRRGLALIFVMGLGLGNIQAQVTLEVGGVSSIGTDVLANNRVPVGGVNWSVNGSNGAGGVYSSLTSPSAAVQNSGPVTLTFTHRYDFENGWDGAAIFVRVNGGAATYVTAAAFTSNGYTGTTTANNSTAWNGGEQVFTGQSAGYTTPSLITSVVNLGTLSAGDTVSVEFRGGWDQAQLNGPPAWEIGTVQIADSAASLQNFNFITDGQSGFTVSNLGNITSPWSYLTPVNRFEINGDTLAADQYAPSAPGSIINLSGARITVALLSGTLNAGENFTLFDLSGGTTLTGTPSSITLPLGVWDTSAFATTGVITYVSGPVDTLYTGPNGAFNSDTWNNAANWNFGIPTGAINAVIETGRHVGVAATTTAIYTGNLTLQANSQLTIGEGSTINGLRAMGTGTITFNAGSRLTLRWSTTSTHSQNFAMAGDATFAIGSSTAAHNDDRTITGVISGAGQMIVRSTNGQRLTIQNTNPLWSGGLIMGGALSENKNEGLRANATGAFGTGNVTIDDGVGLLISVADAIADTATLSLSGGDGEETFKLNMAASDTVDRLIVDGFPQPSGSYGSTASGATHPKPWITGASLLTVASAPIDTTAPTATFAGAGAGGSATNVYIGEPITYTITFSEPHTPALTAANLENSTSTPVTIGSITPLPLNGGMTTLSYRVVVTPTGSGTVKLQIKSGTVINDLFGNALAVPAADNDTLTVDPLPALQCPLGVWKPWANARINPATGNAWAIGDSYRLMMVTNATTTFTSNNIEDYNTFVQNAAAASTTYPNLENGTWKVLGSTEAVNARVNTATDPTTNGTGVSVILMDGFTMLATNHSDLWNGTAARSDVPGTFMSAYLNENNVEITTGQIGTGTNQAGATVANQWFGNSGGSTNVNTGLTRPNNANRWMIQFNATNASTLRVFALSQPLTLQAVGGNTFATWIATFPDVGGQNAIDDDADGDGIDNGVENFFGTDPSAFSRGLIATAVSGSTFTFTHPQNATPASNLTAAYQWSKDLTTFYASGANDGSSTVTFTTQPNTPVAGITTVTATVTGTAASKLFVNVKVTSP